MADLPNFEQFASTRLYGGVVKYSPDSREIAHTNNATGVSNLWTIPSGGGLPWQMTSFSERTVRAFSYSPDGTQLVLQADAQGTERHQLYLLGSRGGRAIPLIENPDAQHCISEWTKDGQWITFSANDANPRFTDVQMLNVETGERQRLTSNKTMCAGEWSPDGEKLLLREDLGTIDRNIWLYDRSTGTLTNCTQHEGEMVYAPASWRQDGRGFYMLTNHEREFFGVAFYSTEANRWDWVYTPDHDVEHCVMANDLPIAIFVVNENGASRLYGLNTETGEAIDLPELPLGVVAGLAINSAGTKVALTFSSATEAPNLYEIDLSSGEMITLGQSMLGGVDPDWMQEPEAITYETFDGRDIPAWLYKPRVIEEGQKLPVVLTIHGGPEAQERPHYKYSGLYQYLLSRGIGVLAPNIRGSTGYGISYQKLIHRDWGGAELKDIEEAAKYLQSLAWVDPNRIAIHGASFGGFAVLSAITRLPEYWSTAVDIVGPSNLVTLMETVPEFWKPMMKAWLGDPVDDYEMLKERSPITYVDNIKVPLLVIQGANDPRVVKAESDQIVERIRENGGEVEYYVDPVEGHGTTKRENGIQWMKMVADYLEKHLVQGGQR